jgi:hypothetical protein
MAENPQDEGSEAEPAKPAARRRSRAAAATANTAAAVPPSPVEATEAAGVSETPEAMADEAAPAETSPPHPVVPESVPPEAESVETAASGVGVEPAAADFAVTTPPATEPLPAPPPATAPIEAETAAPEPANFEPVVAKAQVAAVAKAVSTDPMAAALSLAQQTLQTQTNAIATLVTLTTQWTRHVQTLYSASVKVQQQMLQGFIDRQAGSLPPGRDDKTNT